MNTAIKPVLLEYAGNRIFYKCPRCREVLEFKRKYQGRSLCLKCGQRLDWKPAEDISVEVLTTEDSDEAAWIADQYYKACGTPESERLDTDTWRQSLNGETELYLLFRNRKSHGMFMRKYAKEGIIHDG